MIWFYRIRPKVVWKVHGACIDGYDSPEQRLKHYHYEKIRVYHSKNHVIPHPVIAAILNVILNILQR